MAYQRNGYWYRSVRRGAKVQTEYLGSGVLAELSAELDAVAREEREAQRAAVRAERETQREIDRAIDVAGDALKELTRAALVANGYHLHKGQWRKRRGWRTSCRRTRNRNSWTESGTL